MMVSGHHVRRCWCPDIDYHQAAALPIVGQVGEGTVHHHIDNAANAVQSGQELGLRGLRQVENL